VSGIFTFVFILLPSILNKNGETKLAGIISNAPKIVLFVMIALYFHLLDEANKKITSSTPESEKKNIYNNEYKKIKQHLIVFAISVVIAAVHIYINIAAEQKSTGVDFWVVWFVSLGVSATLIYIIIEWFLKPLSGHKVLEEAVYKPLGTSAQIGDSKNGKKVDSLVLTNHQLRF
jgi:H+/gluconate symporter-like permease